MRIPLDVDADRPVEGGEAPVRLYTADVVAVVPGDASVLGAAKELVADEVGLLLERKGGRQQPDAERGPREPRWQTGRGKRTHRDGARRERDHDRRGEARLCGRCAGLLQHAVLLLERAGHAAQDPGQVAARTMLHLHRRNDQAHAA